MFFIVWMITGRGLDILEVFCILPLGCGVIIVDSLLCHPSPILCYSWICVLG